MKRKKLGSLPTWHSFNSWTHKLHGLMLITVKILTGCLSSVPRSYGDLTHNIKSNQTNNCYKGIYRIVEAGYDSANS